MDRKRIEMWVGAIKRFSNSTAKDKKISVPEDHYKALYKHLHFVNPPIGGYFIDNVWVTLSK